MPFSKLAISKTPTAVPKVRVVGRLVYRRVAPDSGAVWRPQKPSAMPVRIGPRWISPSSPNLVGQRRLARHLGRRCRGLLHDLGHDFRGSRRARPCQSDSRRGPSGRSKAIPPPTTHLVDLVRPIEDELDLGPGHGGAPPGCVTVIASCGSLAKASSHWPRPLPDAFKRRALSDHRRVRAVRVAEGVRFDVDDGIGGITRRVRKHGNCRPSPSRRRDSPRPLAKHCRACTRMVWRRPPQRVGIASFTFV